MSATEVLRAVDLVPKSDGNLYGYHHSVVDEDELDLDDWFDPLFDADGWIALQVGEKPYYIYAHAETLVVAYEETSLNGNGRVRRQQVSRPTALGQVAALDPVRVVHRDVVAEDVGWIDL